MDAEESTQPLLQDLEGQPVWGSPPTLDVRRCGLGLAAAGRRCRLPRHRPPAMPTPAACNPLERALTGTTSLPLSFPASRRRWKSREGGAEQYNVTRAPSLSNFCSLPLFLPCLSSPPQDVEGQGVTEQCTVTQLLAGERQAAVLRFLQDKGVSKLGEFEEEVISLVLMYCFDQKQKHCDWAELMMRDQGGREASAGACDCSLHPCHVGTAQPAASHPPTNPPTNLPIHHPDAGCHRLPSLPGSAAAGVWC